MLYLCFNPLEQDFLIRQPYVLEGVKIAARHLSVGRVEVLVRVDIDPLVTEIVLEEDLGEVRDRHVLVPTYVGEYECLVLPEEAAACQGEGSHHEREDGRHKFAAHLRVRPLWPIARSIVDFFFNDTATTEIYTLSLHDALPISCARPCATASCAARTTQTRWPACGDRKSTRLNSSHANISYAVFCLKKKKM